MLHTKLNRPKLGKDIVQRSFLVEKLEKSNHLPLILISAPAGFGKSMLISQWLENNKTNYAWLSIDESMNDSATFISYLIEMFASAGSVEIQKIKKLDQEYHFLSWEAIIDIIVNTVNEFQKRTRLILDDYYLIKNQEIHELVEALIKEKLDNLQLVIITRWDPPFRFRELRLYQKMLELRMLDLKFEEYEIAELLSIMHQFSFSKAEVKMLSTRTEGWILAIRMILLGKSFSELENKKLGTEILTNDLDRLMYHISENLDPNFSRQMQLCALFDQFGTDLIDSICSFAFPDSCKADVFLSKLKDLNFFLIPMGDEGTWYRFHHLFGDILKRQLKKSEPNIIIPIYLHISLWFADKGLIDEAIKYAVKAENYEFACNLIIEHKKKMLDQYKWWVVQTWLEMIPEQIRKSNHDLLLTELNICHETWRIEDAISILGILKSLNIENAEAKTRSEYLLYLGYHFTFVMSEPKKALECLEESKLLFDDQNMFGARRELILAVSRQMLGQSVLARKSLEDLCKEHHPRSIMHLRSLFSIVFIPLLSGQIQDAITDSKRFQYLAIDCGVKTVEVYVWYFNGNLGFQTFNKAITEQGFLRTITFRGKFNYRVYFDSLSGLILFNSLKGDEKATESFLKKMSKEASGMKDPKFEIYYQSVKARVSWHNGKGDEELDWALNNLGKQYLASYFFLIDVPEMTKIRIVVSHGSVLQVEEALRVLEVVEAFLSKNHNGYHKIDIELLKAMALHRLGNKKRAQESLEKALLLAEKNGVTRPILEVYRVMPSIYSLIKTSNISNRILVRLGLNISTVKIPAPNRLSTVNLSLREQEIIKHIANGLRNKEVADELNISIVTVKSHLTNIYRKLKVSNRTRMVNKILKEEILDL